MDHHDWNELYAALGLSSGISLIIWTSAQAKIAHLRAQAQVLQKARPRPADRAWQAEFQGLKQQVAEMHGTSREYDLSVEDALSRLEGRLARLETRSAAAAGAVPADALPRNVSAYLT